MPISNAPNEPLGASPADRILRPGETCWRIEAFDRMAVIVDAADYFAVLRQAILAARSTVLLIGWDFDTRVTLDHGADDGMPTRLGPLLNFAAKRRPELRIHLLKWDVGLLMTLGRGSTPLFLLDWISERNVRMRLDGRHPSMAAHHQKIVVIDDVLAFCGGIDITADRWDTREHRDDDPRRRRPTTKRRYGPWHDATAAVDGPAAVALGELARDRWRRATGETIPPSEGTAPIWPDDLAPILTGRHLAVARTRPAYDGDPEVREVEALLLEAIARARRTVYCEAQYFASRRAAEAILARLEEPDGPEFVLVGPDTADGWLEEKAMGPARALLLEQIARSPGAGRFRLYTPVTAGGAPIYVHAKILIVDDALVRIGSSNLNNRSMGFDTECDLAVEAEDAETRRAAVRLRDDLVGEHLGCGPQAVREAIAAAGGSLIGAIEALRGAGRSLVPFEPPDFSDVAKELAERKQLDPEAARGFWARTRHRLTDPLRRRLGRHRRARAASRREETPSGEGGQGSSERI